MNKSILTLIAGAALAATVFAEEPKPNEGMTFYDDDKPAEKKEGENEKAPKNIDGISFDIAEKKDPKQIDWVKRSTRGSRGNVTCYVDKDGKTTAVFVIGVAPVSTTMIAVEAEQLAQAEAEANAKEAFALWMKEYIDMKRTLKTKHLVVRTDGEEHSETETKNERVFIQAATASWRGMSVWADMLKDGRYIAVWRWSVQEQQLAHMVELLTQDKDPSSVLGKKDRKTDWKVEEREFSFRDDD